MPTYTPQFRSMTDAYVRDRPRYGLKSITLAQWIIESGRGTSALAQQHLNFGGLKWRADRMAGVEGVSAVWMVTPTEPAGANWTKARDNQAWFDAYWAFIENGPYEDPADYANQPRAYLEMLHRSGYATDPGYVDKVWSVHPEAIELLAESAERQGVDPGQPPHGGQPVGTFKLAVVVGHNRSAQGAHSPHLGISEWPYNSRIAELMAENAADLGIEMKTFFRTPGSGEISRVYAEVDRWGPDLVLELHFNAASASAHGSEMLYWHTSSKGKTLAEAVQAQVVDTFGFRDRGVKPKRQGDRGAASLSASTAPTIITEPFFGSNAADCQKVAGREEALAHSYLRGARDAAVELGMVSDQPVAPPVQPPIEPPIEPGPVPYLVSLQTTWSDGAVTHFDRREE